MFSCGIKNPIHVQNTLSINGAGVFTTGGTISYQDTFVWRKLHFYGEAAEAVKPGEHVPPGKVWFHHL